MEYRHHKISLGVQISHCLPGFQSTYTCVRGFSGVQASVVTWNAKISPTLFKLLFVCFWLENPQWARASSVTRFLDHTQRRITIGRNPLDK